MSRDYDTGATLDLASNPSVVRMSAFGKIDSRNPAAACEYVLRLSILEEDVPVWILVQLVEATNGRFGLQFPAGAVLGFFIAVVLGLIAGLVPALSAYRAKITDILRTV